MATLNNREFKYHLVMHVVVLIWGMTGVLGKLITLPSDVLVTYRLAIAVLSLIVYFAVLRKPVALPLTRMALCLAIGLLVGFHWVLFFESIKQSTVSVALVCMATAPFFVALIEPVLFRRPIRGYEILLGVAAAGGIVCIYNFELQYKLGIAWAILSALVGAVFTVFNGILIRRGWNATVFSFYELCGGVMGVGCYAWIATPVATGLWRPTPIDWIYLVILGSLCTAFAFVAAMAVMRVLSPFTAMLTVNLEPIYGIVLALIVFGDAEYMSGGFYAGAGIILATIAGNAMIKGARGSAMYETAPNTGSSEG